MSSEVEVGVPIGMTRTPLLVEAKGPESNQESFFFPDSLLRLYRTSIRKRCWSLNDRRGIQSSSFYHFCI